MQLTVKYFGIIADFTQKKETFLPLDASIDTIEKLLCYLQELYPEIKNVTFSIALNEKLISKNEALIDGDEIALLPPFAGG
ncbi:MoaD/ThiS family protein [Flavobacterium sp. CYK-4]|uniref:MoaD/ThiS family protein n=1 Tax=Flavobacterium lotistagni TaxID=2709660 RepID=UPI00140DB17B|nr:MoaD/ThiS family protein [Flavobacterium lotistagni]NHM07103.1 MoaD/ThiS family protein [Flavobacterium lotistagni]